MRPAAARNGGTHDKLSPQRAIRCDVHLAWQGGALATGPGHQVLPARVARLIIPQLQHDGAEDLYGQACQGLNNCEEPPKGGSIPCCRDKPEGETPATSLVAAESATSPSKGV